MWKYFAGRLVQLVPVLFIMSLIVFLVMYLLPGDPAQLALMGQSAISIEDVKEIRRQLGLDDPIYVQYGRYLAGAVRGDLGISIRFRRPVTAIVLEQFPATLVLSLWAMLITVVSGLILGIIAALKRYTWMDTFSMLLSLVGVSMPVFFSGLMGIFLFSFHLGWLPSSGTAGWKAMVLPALTLGLGGAGTVARLTRSGLLEAMAQDFVRTARAKGLQEWAVIWKHAMKNAMIPIITVMGGRFGATLSGAVIAETVFSRQGVGRLLVSAIEWKDFTLAQGTILLTALSYVLVNLLVDLSYAYFDPRIRYE